MAPKEKPSAPSTTQQATEPAAETKKAELLAVRENIQDTELGEALCYDIVQEVVGQAENLMLDNYYDRAAVPYTVQCLCREILDVVQIVFIARDPGEQSEDAQASWQPDVEPSPCPIDSWARGAVPIRKATNAPDARPPPASGEKRPKRDSSPRTGARGKLQASGSDFSHQTAEMKSTGRTEKQNNRGGGSERTPREAAPPEGGHEHDVVPGFARPEHRRKEIREAADRQRDALKEAQGPKGGREFTVDSISGRVIPVKSMDPSRLPNRKLDVRVGVETQQQQCNETESPPPAGKPSAKRSKAPGKQTSDFVQPEDTHGPMVDSVLPSGGVLLKDGDKMARGERRHSKSRISREQFAKMLDAAGVQRENFGVTQGSQDLRASAAQASQEASQVGEYPKQEPISQKTPPAKEETRIKSTPQRSVPASFPTENAYAPPPGFTSQTQQSPAQLAPQATAPLPPFKAPREDLLGQRRVYPRERGARSPRPTVDRRGLPPPLFPATERTAVPSSEGTESAAPPNQSTPPRIRRYTDARGNQIADDFFAELEGDDQS